jgi:hypothetical protein
MMRQQDWEDQSRGSGDGWIGRGRRTLEIQDLAHEDLLALTDYYDCRTVLLRVELKRATAEIVRRIVREELVVKQSLHRALLAELSRRCRDAADHE